MPLAGPHGLDANHVLDDFDCGKASLNDWLVRYARQAQSSGSAKTYVVAEGQHVAGYFSLTVGQIDTLEAPDRVRKGMAGYPIPMIILARLAVDQRMHGRVSVWVCCKKPFDVRFLFPNRPVCAPY